MCDGENRFKKALTSPWLWVPAASLFFAAPAVALLAPAAALLGWGLSSSSAPRPWPPPPPRAPFDRRRFNRLMLTGLLPLLGLALSAGCLSAQNANGQGRSHPVVLPAASLALWLAALAVGNLLYAALAFPDAVLAWWYRRPPAPPKAPPPTREQRAARAIAEHRKVREEIAALPDPVLRRFAAAGADKALRKRMWDIYGDN